MDTNIRICGEAGQGVQTLGVLLLRALHAAGLHVFGAQGYMSRIRGGVNSFDIRISDAELFSARESADLLVALSGESLEANRKGVAAGGLVVFDGAAGDGEIGLDMAALAKEAGGTGRMKNSVAAGVAMELLGYDVEGLCAVLEAEFSGKGAEVAAANAACARKGAAAVAERRGAVAAPPRGEAAGEVFGGGEAFGLSAAVSGVKVVCSYPMSPSTAVFQYLAGVGEEYGIVVEQAEDEICAVNLICGAAYAGAPAMTTTSGGGFALMVEGLSLAGMLELPIVVFLGQRPGPATGLPTRTAQGDLRFAVFAGHGEFPRAIFAPGSLPQAFALTRRALETAHRFQTPVILMADQFLVDQRKNIEKLPRLPDPIDRCIVGDPAPDYVRYAPTDSGVSPRALPGGEVFVISDSDEHTPDGHLTEDLGVRVEMQEKRMRKCGGLLAEALAPEVYPAPAEEALLCWGSTYGPCREAVDILRGRGRKVCMVHFPQVWPIDPEAARAALAGRKVTAVECSGSAQFAYLLRATGALGECGEILKYDGLPFTGEEIAGRV